MRLDGFWNVVKTWVKVKWQNLTKVFASIQHGIIAIGSVYDIVGIDASRGILRILINPTLCFKAGLVLEVLRTIEVAGVETRSGHGTTYNSWFYAPFCPNFHAFPFLSPHWTSHISSMTPSRSSFDVFRKCPRLCLSRKTRIMSSIWFLPIEAYSSWCL